MFSHTFLTRIKKVGANMQINKGNINLKEQIACVSASVLVEGDVVVSDSYPDVTEILCADAKVKVKNTEYRNGKATLSGVVEFSALYMPDNEETELKCMSHSFDFSADLDVRADENTEFCATAMAEHIGFTLVNSRKLSVKVMVGVRLCAYQDRCYEPIIEMSGENIEKTEKKYSIYIPMAENCTDINVNDLLTVPDDMSDIAEILKVDAWVTSGDVRVMNGKAMVQGELHLNTLYTSADDRGSVACVHHTVPFTEIVEAPGADEQSVVNVKFLVSEITANIKGDLNGDTKIISMESVICACVKVSRTVVETLVDDCYFLDSNTHTKRETMKICEYVTSENTRITSNQTAQPPKNVKIKEIISCNANSILKEAKWESGLVQVNGVLVTYLIYRDDKDVVRCAVTESEINWEKAISEPCDVEAILSLENVNATAGENEAQILVNTGLYVKALKSKKVDILTECDAKEDEITKTTPTMVIYFAKDGDTVWNVAKKYRTKSELIKEANGLEAEKIEQGRRLLIPMV